MEKFVLKAIVPALFLFSLNACAPVPLDDETGAPSFVVLQGDIEKDENGGLTGSGLIRFDKTLSSPAETLKAEMIVTLSARGSFLTVRSHGEDSLVVNGVNVTLYRDNNDKVAGTIQIGGQSHTIVAPMLATLPYSSLGLALTIENGANVRVIGKLLTGTVVFDTANPGDVDRIVTADPREGDLVGLRLSNVFVKKFSF